MVFGYVLSRSLCPVFTISVCGVTVYSYGRGNTVVKLQKSFLINDNGSAFLSPELAGFVNIVIKKCFHNKSVLGRY